MNKPIGCSECEYRNIGEGFCPDSVPTAPPQKPRLAVCVSSPSTAEADADEPSPLQGPSGFLLDAWVMPRADLSGYSMSKMNVLHCGPPDNSYPRGKIRYAAERKCRQYDKFTPKDFDVTLVTIHPQHVLRDKYDLLPLIVSDFRKVKTILDSGRSVFVCAGLEAMELWLPNLRVSENEWTKTGVKRWRGSFFGKDVRYPSLPDAVGTCDFDPTLPVGLDLEWNASGITSFSLYNGKQVLFGEGNLDIVRKTVELSPAIIGHNLLGANSDVDHLAAVGINLPTEKCRDTMLLFHMLWPQFAGHGHLDLWSMTSLYTEWPNWKACRGEGYCSGPCPVHQPREYNILDTMAAYVSYFGMLPELQLRGLI